MRIGKSIRLRDKQRGYLSAAMKLILFGGVSPSFDLPLLTTLVPTVAKGSGTPTFTRATTAYVPDFEGLLKPVISGEARFQGARRVENFATRNTEVLTAGGGWVLSNVTTVGGIADPVGGTSAYTLTATAGNGFIYNNDPVVAAQIGGSRVGTVWIRRRTGTGAINFQVGAASAVAITSFVTSSWQRISSGVITNGLAGAEKRLLIQLVTSGDAVDIWRPQGEIVTGQTNQNPSEYVSVGVLSAPYHGAGVDGVKYFATENGNTVASNVVTEATGAAISSATLLGYLAEGAGKNLLTQSQTFSHAGWGKINVTVTADQTAAPDGTTTADLCVPIAMAGTHLVRNGGTTAAVQHAQSIFVKAAGYTKVGIREDYAVGQFASFLLSGAGSVIDKTAAATANITARTNGWYELSFIPTTTSANQGMGLYIMDAAYASGNPDGYAYAGDATSGVYLWGAQLEAASFASSYIPTTTAAVTRNAEVDGYPSASNIATTGAFVAELTPISATSRTGYVFGSYTDANNSLALLFDGTNLIARKRIGGTDYDATIAYTMAAGTTVKVGMRWGADGVDVWLNGAKGTGNANATTAVIATTFQIGADGNSANQPFASIKNGKAYPRALSDSKMASLAT